MGFLCVLFVILTVIPSIDSRYNVLVSTNHGAVEGFAIPSQYAQRYRKHINIFLGIPYAKRPVEYNNDPRLYRFKVNLHLLIKSMFNFVYDCAVSQLVSLSDNNLRLHV